MKIRAKERPRYAKTPKALLKAWDKHPADSSHKLRFRAEYLAHDGKWYPCYTRRYSKTKRQALKQARQYALDRHLVFSSSTSQWLRSRELLQAEFEKLGDYTVQTDLRSYRNFARGARIALQWVLRNPPSIEAPSHYLEKGEI